jgi:hypothetical protein
MMWKAITYIGSGLSLAAFIAAVAASILRQKILERERLIRLAPETERAELVEKTLEFFSVDTATLTRSQKYDLAIHQIRAKALRFRTSAVVIIVLAFLAAGVTLFALAQKSNGTVHQTGEVNSKPSPTLEENSDLRGEVDDSSQMPIANATVKVDEIPGKPPMEYRTTSDGSFLVRGIPLKVGTQVRVYVSKEGYVSDDAYVALPGPIRFHLRKK